VGIDELSIQQPINFTNKKIYTNKNKKHNVWNKTDWNFQFSWPQLQCNPYFIPTNLYPISLVKWCIFVNILG
jgi:hypothetical protein